MAKGYWINCFRSIKDPAKVDAYRQLAGPAMEAAGAKFLVRGDPAKVYEAGIVGRVVVIEFESVDKAMAMNRAMLQDHEYQQMLDKAQTLWVEGSMRDALVNLPV